MERDAQVTPNKPRQQDRKPPLRSGFFAPAPGVKPLNRE